MTRIRSRPRLSMAGLAVAGLIGLSACSSPDQASPEQGEPSPTEQPATMAQALAGLYVPATDDPEDQPQVGQCLEQAVGQAEITDEARTLILESAPDEDLGSVIAAMDQDDRDTMLTSELRQATDDCLLEITGMSGSDHQSAPSSSSTQAANEADENDEKDDQKPDTEPVVKIRDDQAIRDSGVLRRGVVSMFGSFAVDENQQKVYERSAECFSQTIFSSGLSQDGLRFIAGGAPLGTGSIAEHLSEEDRAIWESNAFTDQMLICTQEAEDELADGSASDDPSANPSPSAPAGSRN